MTYLSIPNDIVRDREGHPIKPNDLFIYNNLAKKEIEEDRMQYALLQLNIIGIEADQLSNSAITFIYKGEKVLFYPYTGWATGKSIKDTRGINNLLKQLK